MAYPNPRAWRALSFRFPCSRQPSLGTGTGGRGPLSPLGESSQELGNQGVGCGCGCDRDCNLSQKLQGGGLWVPPMAVSALVTWPPQKGSLPHPSRTLNTHSPHPLSGRGSVWNCHAYWYHLHTQRTIMSSLFGPWLCPCLGPPALLMHALPPVCSQTTARFFKGQSCRKFA